MASKKKGRGAKKESLLKHRAHSKNFVVAYDLNDAGLNIFFGISGKTACAVVRNRVKRIFRDITRKELSGRRLSICLISKKTLTVPNDEAVIAELKKEVYELVKEVAKKNG
ncbi:MAG: ribonuclease P protein component [Pseudomonadota bacterium]